MTAWLAEGARRVLGGSLCTLELAYLGYLTPGSGLRYFAKPSFATPAWLTFLLSGAATRGVAILDFPLLSPNVLIGRGLFVSF